MASPDDVEDVEARDYRAPSRRPTAITTALPPVPKPKSKGKKTPTPKSAKATPKEREVPKGTTPKSKSRTKKSKTPKIPKEKPATSEDENDTSSKSGGGADSDVERMVVKRSQASLRKIQVKQQSFAGQSARSVAPASETAAEPTMDETGGLASGHYGLLLETKRAELLCRSLSLRKWHVAQLMRAFRREDLLRSGAITTDEFFALLHEQPRQLTLGLFATVGLPRRPRLLKFDDFVLCVASLASWSKQELLEYAFTQFDADESGAMDSRELRAFCGGLKNDSSFYFAKNVDKARRKIVARDYQHQRQQLQYQEGKPPEPDEADALVDLEDLAQGSTEFQVAFYPLLQLQQNARACALGENFWARIAQRREQVEVAVHYMRLHNRKLPPLSLWERILARLLPFSRARMKVEVYELAIRKFADEVQQREAERWAEIEAKAEKEALAQVPAQDKTGEPSSGGEAGIEIQPFQSND